MKNIIPQVTLVYILLLQSSFACTSLAETPIPLPTLTPTTVVEQINAEPTSVSMSPSVVPTTLSSLDIGLENVNALVPSYIIQAEPGWIYNLAFSPDGSLLTGSVEQNEIQIWDARDGHLSKTLTAHRAQIMHVAFSPDGEWFASSSIDHTILLWRVVDWEPIMRLEGHTSYVNALAFSPDSRLLASGGEDRKVVVWSVEGGEMIYSSEAPILGVKDVSFSPDGKLLAEASGETRVRVWDVETWEMLWTLLGPTPQYRLAFSPDGKALATAPWSIDANNWEPLAPIVFWDLSEGDRMGSSEVNTVALSLAYSNDGRLIFSGSDEDGIIRVWRTMDGGLLAELTGHHGRVTAIAVHPDGTRLASGDDEGRIIVWALNAGE